MVQARRRREGVQQKRKKRPIRTGDGKQGSRQKEKVVWVTIGQWRYGLAVKNSKRDRAVVRTVFVRTDMALCYLVLFLFCFFVVFSSFRQQTALGTLPSVYGVRAHALYLTYSEFLYVRVRSTSTDTSTENKYKDAHSPCQPASLTSHGHQRVPASNGAR